MLMLGLIVLTLGAELLVRSATKLASAAGISPLVIGLTVVAFGTSAPELVVSLQSTLSGQPDVALGNVLGSNILNILFILGISAVIVPLVVSQQLIRFDVPLMVGLSVLVLILALDGHIGRLDGLLLTAGLISYNFWAVWKSRKEQAVVKAEHEANFGVAEKASDLRGILLNLALLIAGLALLVLGSRWFVEAVTTIARSLGVSELVIGLTVVAAGTSLPEVATSIMAAIRGERDIAVGNVVGSNIFNILGVLGISSLVSANGIGISDMALRLDIPVMVAVAFACLPIFFTGHMISRWEGGLFLGYYIAYTAYLITAATIPSMPRTFGTVMLGFVIPLTTITLAITVVRTIRQNAHSERDSQSS
ncbi:Inner membrane protein YrbG [Thalassoglobus polymorphus]|uniref:Inner membrane protein YrbG n=2 Tax=Thalassoglobus polymorphus TaxID=2527994 RepID=A0A517QIK6_9PLAN|nr:Inner membrane protein YrbG [Thalassoglobus polymorphus]